jgi:hypothetical protein
VLRTAKKTHKKNLLAKVEDKLEEWTEEYDDKQLLEFSLQFMSQNEEKQPEVLSLEVILPEEMPPIAQVTSQRIKKRHR